MPRDALSRSPSVSVYSIGERTRGARDDASMRLRVGGPRHDVDRSRREHAVARECVDAWGEATGRVSVLVRTLSRSARDIESASRETLRAMRRLARSLVRALLPHARPDAAPAETPLPATAPKSRMRRMPVPEMRLPVPVSPA